jgi:hypothetical protein
MTEYGNGGSFTVMMDGPFAGGGGGSEAKLSVFTAPAANWKGAASPYSQVVELEDISINTRVDIYLSADQIQQLHDADKSISFTAENEDGVVTIFAVGSKPEFDLEFQVVLMEVIAV